MGQIGTNDVDLWRSVPNACSLLKFTIENLILASFYRCYLAKILYNFLQHRRMKQDLQEVRRKGAKNFTRQYGERTCARCQRPLGKFWNSGDVCHGCSHRICSRCRVGATNWKCTVCYAYRWGHSFTPTTTMQMSESAVVRPELLMTGEGWWSCGNRQLCGGTCRTRARSKSPFCQTWHKKQFDHFKEQSYNKLTLSSSGVFVPASLTWVFVWSQGGEDQVWRVVFRGKAEEISSQYR